MALVARDSRGRAPDTLLSRRQKQMGPGGDSGLGIPRAAWSGRSSNLKTDGGSREW